MIDVDTFINENKNLISSVARKFPANTEKYSREDLEQEAMVAAIEAIDSFDESKGRKLTTHVYEAAYFACLNYVMANTYDLTVTNHYQSKKYVEQKLKNNPDLDKSSVLADGRAIRGDAIAVKSGIETVSFNEIIPSGEIPVHDLIVKREEEEMLVDAINSALSPKERKVLKLVYQDGLTMQDVARRNGLTKQRISQIASKAIEKLSEQVR